MHSYLFVTPVNKLWKQLGMGSFSKCYYIRPEVIVIQGEVGCLWTSKMKYIACLESVVCDCNWTRTHNHLVHKWTINRLAKLAKWLSCFVSTYLYGAFDCMVLPCHVHVSEWMHVSEWILTTQLNHLASLTKQLSIRLWTKWLWVQANLQSLKLQILRLLRARVPWHSGNYRVWIHSETPMWYDKTIQCYVSSKIGFYFAEIWYTSIFSVLFPDSFLKRSIGPLFCFSSNIDENNDTVHVIEGFVF